MRPLEFQPFGAGRHLRAHIRDQIRVRTGQKIERSLDSSGVLVHGCPFFANAAARLQMMAQTDARSQRLARPQAEVIRRVCQQPSAGFAAQIRAEVLLLDKIEDRSRTA